MRAAFVTAAIAAVVLPIAAAPIPGEVTSKGHIMPSMDTPRLLKSQENKRLNQIVSVLRPETATHTKENNTISVTSAQVGAIGVAIDEYAANAGKSVKRDQVGSDDAPGSKPYHDAYQRYRQEAERNVSITAAASDNQPTLPTDAELEAIGALLQAPSPTFDVHVGDIELHDVGDIIGAMSAGKSLDEIHQAFHSRDGKPVYLTDDEVDSAIGGYYMDASSDIGAQWYNRKQTAAVPTKILRKGNDTLRFNRLQYNGLFLNNSSDGRSAG